MKYKFIELLLLYHYCFIEEFWYITKYKKHHTTVNEKTSLQKKSEQKQNYLVKLNLSFKPMTHGIRKPTSATQKHLFQQLIKQNLPLSKFSQFLVHKGSCTVLRNKIHFCYDFFMFLGSISKIVKTKVLLKASEDVKL